MSDQTETPDLAELRRLAEAATPGPWVAATGAALIADAGDDATHVWYRRWRDERFLSIGKVLDNELDQTTPEDADYIAAANPAVVLALLDAADALRAELAHMREARDNARAEVERLTAVVEAVREDARDIARDSGDDKGCYGVDFWAGMCKAAARIDGRIRHALDGRADAQSGALAFELPKPPTGHMVGGLITEGHQGQRFRPGETCPQRDAAELLAALDEEPQP